MLVGGADNLDVKVFGYGAWLKDNDLTDPSSVVERMSDKMASYSQYFLVIV
jgi:hypothetical protein